jgi:hypothetical protein
MLESNHSDFMSELRLRLIRTTKEFKLGCLASTKPSC